MKKWVILLSISVLLSCCCCCCYYCLPKQYPLPWDLYSTHKGLLLSIHFLFYKNHFQKKMCYKVEGLREFLFLKSKYLYTLLPFNCFDGFWSSHTVDFMAPFIFIKAKKKSWIFHLNSCWFFTWIRVDFSPDFVFY